MVFQKKFGFWQLVSALGILGLILLTLIYGFRPQNFESRLKKAEKAQQAKHVEDAIRIYLKLIDQDPKNSKVPEILLKVGDLYHLSLNQIDAAAKTYDLVAIRYSSTPFALQALIRKGELFFNSNQFEAALREYQNILFNFPGMKEQELYRLKLGICHLKIKQFEAARREFKAILDLNLNTELADQVLFYTANSYLLEDNPSAAIPIYQSILEHYPQSIQRDEVRFNLADCYENLGEYDQALRLYQQIQATYPNPKVIELQIQRNQEKKAAAESRRAERDSVSIPKKAEVLK